MIVKIDFNKPFIPEEDILAITPQDISGQYSVSSETEKFNLFFVLLTTFHSCQDNKKVALAAYVSYLISYYLFVALTPPGSEELAIYYAKKSLELNTSSVYIEWYNFVLTGN